MVYNFTVDALHTYTVTELRVVVHNVENCFRKYDPSPKHDPISGWGSPMDLDDVTAERVLNEGWQPEGKKQIYGYYDGKLYEFQPDNVGAYHGYRIPGVEAPTAYLRELQRTETITSSQYNKLRKQTKKDAGLES